MVLNYSPEPERDRDDGFNIEGANVIMDIESSDDDIHITTNHTDLAPDQFAYELLPQEPTACIDNNVSKNMHLHDY